MRVLVDTCVFVDFLRGKAKPELERLILENSAVLSPLVRLEILSRTRKHEVERLSYVLDGLERLPHDELVVREAGELLQRAKNAGLTLGMMDLLIASEARLNQCDVYSSDGAFAQLARLGLVALFKEAR